MSGRSYKLSPDTAFYDRISTHPLFILLILLILFRGTSSIVQVLIPAPFYFDDGSVAALEKTINNRNVIVGTDNDHFLVLGQSCFNPPPEPPTPAAEGNKAVAANRESSDKVFSINDDFDIRPQLIWMRQPSYPDGAKSAAVEGRVLLHILVGETGSAKEVKIAEEYPADAGFGQCCLAPAKKAVYAPGVKNNRPVKGWMAVPVEFKP